MKKLYGWIKGFVHNIKAEGEHAPVMYWDYDTKKKLRIACHGCDKTFWNK